ncbi:virulence factor [Minwuia sp.]|uniref:virulence factor n=1 Tax=Minwuia sp. TaxID=2493630 RepID=UPI003A8E8B9D
MAQKIVVYWRDIPAQVIVKAGRKRATVELPERFIQAIDRTAMKLGAKDSDAYLAEWRRGEPETVDGDLEALAGQFAAQLETEFPQERINAMVTNGGRADG